MHVRFRHSLAGRLVLFGVLPTLALVGSLVALALKEKYETLQAGVERQLTSAAKLAAGRAEDRVNDTARTARLLADAIGSRARIDPTEVTTLLARVLERDPVVTATWVVFEMDSVPPESLKAAGPSLVNGRFAPRAFRDAKRGSRPSVGSAADAARSDAYQRPSSAFRAKGTLEHWFGDPVVRDGETVIEIGYPIISNGKLLGVAGAEYATRDTDTALRAMATELDLDIFAVNEAGHVIAASIDPPSSAELPARRIEDMPHAPVLVPIARAPLQTRIFTDRDPVSGEECYVATASSTAGGWRIVLMKPVSAIMRPAFATVVRNLFFASSGLVLLASLLVALALSVRRRIDSAVRAAERIAQGDLTVRLTTNGGQDEAGALLETLGTMAERLSALIARVQAAGRTLDASVVELGKSTLTQKHAATPLGQTTTEVAAAAKQISATGVELVRTVESVQMNAAATADLAKLGREQLAAVDGSMRELDGATASVAAKLATINERAVAINAVVTAITKVADQTNLLSVNAAIEAEKTGELGRGFLVVAREIRRLADQTAGSTLDITRLVEEMQSAVSAGVMEMDRFAEKVRRGVEDVNETSRQMGAIIGQVAENTERFRAVSEGIASQSAGAVQISDATAQIQHSARAAIDGIARLAAAARSIEGATSTLHSEVCAFRIDESHV
jgi:methyl-accepting chemotaxis protein